MKTILTPIEKSKNLGPVTGQKLREIGIETLEELKKRGWEQSCIDLVLHSPMMANLNCFTAIIGAINNQDWRNIDPKLKQKAKELLESLK